MANDAEDDESIAVVSHGTFMDSLLKALLGRLPGNEFYFNHHNTGITRIDFQSWKTSGVLPFIRYANRADHLTDDDMTF